MEFGHSFGTVEKQGRWQEHQEKLLGFLEPRSLNYIWVVEFDEAADGEDDED